MEPGIIGSIREDKNAVWYEILADDEIIKYVDWKRVNINWWNKSYSRLCCKKGFKVSTIPHTRISTNLKYRNVGDTVNLECDIIGKYVEKLLGYSECNEKKEQKLQKAI